MSTCILDLVGFSKEDGGGHRGYNGSCFVLVDSFSRMTLDELKSCTESHIISVTEAWNHAIVPLEPP